MAAENGVVTFGLNIGDAFDSFEAVQTRIKEVEDATAVQLYRRDCKTLAASVARYPGRAGKAKPELKYYLLAYCCVFGGKTHKSRSTGDRTNTKTLKQQCPAAIKFGLSSDCQQLVVTNITEAHNHEVSQIVYAHLPRQRRMTREDKVIAADMLKLKSNKKLLQVYMHEKTGKVVTLRDVSNIQAKIRSHDGHDLAKVVTRLKAMEGSFVEVFHDEEGTFTGLFFQDSLMRKMYCSFPEVIMADATYKLTALRMPLFLMLGIDGNGHSQVIAVYLTSTETAAALTHMLETFKSHNDAWSRTEVIMTDKDMSERNVFGTAFPAATLQLCLFHTLRSFSREVTLEKMGIRSGQRDALLGIFNAMAVARCEQQFDEQCALLDEMSIPAASAYFRRNWLPIRNEWVACFKARHFMFGEQTNNRLESLNGKIKSVCSGFSSLDTFFSEFFTVLRVLRGERDHSSIMSRISKSTCHDTATTTEDRHYEKLLTAHAYGHVLAEIAKRGTVQLPEDAGAPVPSSEGPLMVTDSTCTCAFRCSFRLPCRHIFARRQMSGKSSFDATLADNRWTVSYSVDSVSTVSVMQVSEVASATSLAVLTAHQKYRQAMAVAADLASLASEVGMQHFRERLDMLRNLRAEWAIDVDTLKQLKMPPVMRKRGRPN